jgi:hypothetical protein
MQRFTGTHTASAPGAPRDPRSTRRVITGRTLIDGRSTRP